ncbi:possible urease accessory protein UreF [Fulvimarina pelagi HTCC2506]|uniref:Urease accessory protein UreF n=1 Tax=Fulvimarina pelagi HTCC2506 TaxID=314231 RepID=Q0G3L1_9HYPH|nr:urease accessory protein UreF [Fulvimarina pelagi]EAU41820.1 possible urease accessory protein UreF [Fulvimarina pelagi HTCC2506]
MNRGPDSEEAIREAPTHTGFVSLITLFSQSFPIGSFAWSHGLESTVRGGLVTNADETRDWIAFLLRSGSGWNDAVLFTESYDAASDHDQSRLDAANELALALGFSAERRTETEHFGEAFREASRPWQSADAIAIANSPVAYPVAAGALSASLKLPRTEVLTAFLHGFSNMLVQAAIRLIPLGQSDAVKITHALGPSIVETASLAASSSLDDLGSAALLSDIHSMRHETLSPRLFSS